MSVSERDLRTMVRIATSPDEGDPGEPLPWSILSELNTLIPADSLVFNQIDSQRCELPLYQELYEGLPDEDPHGDDAALDAALGEGFWTHYWSCQQCSYPDQTGDTVSVTRLSDFYTTPKLHSTGMWADYLRLIGMEHEIMLCLPSQPGRTLRLLLWRGPGSDFSERDRALLILLRPHLEARFRRWRRRYQPPRLTPRQRQLLRLVAAGHTNRQIARALSITEGTVRTHLENIFERLQVTSRAAAVTRAFPDGLDGLGGDAMHRP